MTQAAPGGSSSADLAQAGKRRRSSTGAGEQHDGTRGDGKTTGRASGSASRCTQQPITPAQSASEQIEPRLQSDGNVWHSTCSGDGPVHERAW